MDIIIVISQNLRYFPPLDVSDNTTSKQIVVFYNVVKYYTVHSIECSTEYTCRLLRGGLPWTSTHYFFCSRRGSLTRKARRGNRYVNLQKTKQLFVMAKNPYKKISECTLVINWENKWGQHRISCGDDDNVARCRTDTSSLIIDGVYIAQRPSNLHFFSVAVGCHKYHTHFNSI